MAMVVDYGSYDQVILHKTPFYSQLRWETLLPGWMKSAGILRKPRYQGTSISLLDLRATSSWRLAKYWSLQSDSQGNKFWQHQNKLWSRFFPLSLQMRAQTIWGLDCSLVRPPTEDQGKLCPDSWPVETVT